jgi:ketosteroid isomerase-like protein
VAHAAGAAAAAEGRDAAWRAVVATELAFAREAEARGTKEAFLAFLADDGVVFQPGPVDGKSWWKDRPRPPGALRWRPAYAAAARDGGLGFTTGPWLFEAPPRDGAPPPAPAHGWFATIWRRQADGTYRFVADGGVGAGGPAPDLAAVVAHESFRPPAAAPAKDDAVRVMSLEAMEARFLALAQQRGLAAAYGELLDPEARALRGERGLLSGREAIAAAAAAQPVPASWTVQQSGVAESNDLGYTRGAWVAAGEKPASGWFLRAWRREPGGGWQLALDLLMSGPPGS